MEKFSAYRDPGTGIQPFLTPVPPLGAEFVAKVTLPVRYILAVVRTALVLTLALIYIILVKGLFLVFYPIPPLYRTIDNLFTYVIGRTALFTLGLFWINVEQFNRKRVRGPKLVEKCSPKAADVIVSNWASWIDVVWLAIRFNPIFVLPVPVSLPESTVASRASTPVSHTPGRRTGTGSANIQVASRTTTLRVPISGFRQLSLLSMIIHTGGVPPYGSMECRPLEDIRRSASRPIVVFPECTTSNGRGLLRFADVFRQTVPVKKFQVFVVSIRYDPPTNLAPTLTHTMPSRIFNPLPHIFSLGTALSSAQMSIRLLAPSESPSSQLFMVHEVLSDYAGEDQLSETCAHLISQMGKLKRMGLGWEEKYHFLDFYKGKSK
ncbi:hypothetical protein JR316_0005033 [Psilocybe cubensis]|uniref:Uncharacterized protein n=2 Tax=Psilocybe cubensis TaxID=181762 RepID=A0ACB8H4U2_PSICU|nr:hypothetical protein JR316_0005033 [Psilocybe cubensis]KAH9482933.1 hypothetical protein JR316_0005033 [Psilocybe cubensis]